MTEQDDGLGPYQEEELADLFHRVFRMMGRRAHRTSRAPYAQQRVLALIRERGPLTQGELQEVLDVRSSSLSEILRKLENNGCIVRRRNDADKRGYILTINEDAPGALLKTMETAQPTSPALFSWLEEGEQRQLRDLLVKILVHLGQEGEPHGGLHRHERSGGHGRGCGHDRHRPGLDQPIRGRGGRRKR